MAKRVVRSRKGAPKPPNYKGRVRQFRLGQGLPTPEQIREEIREYRDVLMGRTDPPLQRGVMTLMEIAEGYFSRACELEQLILEAQQDGRVTKDSEYHTLRTQELRSFKEMTKSATELGSRRITFENLQFQKESRGLESI